MDDEFKRDCYAAPKGKNSQVKGLNSDDTLENNNSVVPKK
jgi:hypothetical protein